VLDAVFTPLESEPRKRRKSLRSRGKSLHYYAKCMAILSKAKPWQRVRVVKALCLLVGINWIKQADRR